MIDLMALIAPLALLTLVPGQGADGRDRAESVNLDPDIETVADVGRGTLALPITQADRTPVQNQVRIEQRVIVRITPRRTLSRQSMVADMPPQPVTRRFEERKMEKCIPVGHIAGVQTGSGNRLLLFLRDRRIVSANLEKSCRARDFYSGFYLEQNDDGKLCVDRDKLQSRSGAKCEVDRFRKLEEVTE